MIKFLILYSVIFIISCVEPPYAPKDLRKLTHEEIEARARRGIMPNPKIVLKNEKGEIIPADSIPQIPNIESWTTDVYVNTNDLDVELVMRKATEADLALRDRLNQIKQEGPAVEIHDIDCVNQKIILEHVLQSDQSMRQEGTHIDPGTDHQNLSLVVSLLKKCGMPTLAEVDPQHMQAIWLVIQHAGNKYRKEYFPLFETAARNGDLDQTHVAMMKDRMLMDDGLPQVYGTQVVMVQESDRYKLYTLQTPGSVDKRRAEIGFGPLHEYLQRWDITFDVPQEK